MTSSLPADFEEEILALTLLVQQGEADDFQRARLERLLSDHPAARIRYVEIVDDTVTLAHTAGDSASTDEPSARFLRDVKELPAESPAQSTGETGSRFPSAGRAGGVIALLAASLVAVSLWLGNSSGRQAERSLATGRQIESNGQEPGYLGRVVNIADVRFSQGAKTFAAWSSLLAGDSVQLEEGKLELVLEGTVQLLIAGPADVRFVSARKAIARRGQLVARMGPEAAGFEVETPDAQVIDRGTSFGLSIDPGERTSVVVYEGIVDLAPRTTGQVSPASHRLEQGEAMCVNSSGTLGRIASVAASSFLPPPAINDISPRPPTVIGKVTDNKSLQETAKYYRIIADGIREDRPAYVDRIHQWNGIDEQGIPPFLRTAEYVMTYNDDKVSENLQMAVQLTQPATVYVLWDDRVVPTAWLSAEFTDTQWDVGLDEGYETERPSTSRVTATGAGQSIDRTFSVWSRLVPEAGTVMLGSAAAVTEETLEGKPAEGRPVENRTDEDAGDGTHVRNPRRYPFCMYAVAAAPLGQSR